MRPAAPTLLKPWARSVDLRFVANHFSVRIDNDYASFGVLSSGAFEPQLFWIKTPTSTESQRRGAGSTFLHESCRTAVCWVVYS